MRRCAVNGEDIMSERRERIAPSHTIRRLGYRASVERSKLINSVVIATAAVDVVIVVKLHLLIHLVLIDNLAICSARPSAQRIEGWAGLAAI